MKPWPIADLTTLLAEIVGVNVADGDTVLLGDTVRVLLEVRVLLGV